MFSLGRRSRGASLQSWRPVIHAGGDMSPTEACRVAKIKTYNSVHCGDLKL